MSHYREFDYVIVNDDFAQAVADLRRIVAGDAAGAVEPARRHLRRCSPNCSARPRRARRGMLHEDTLIATLAVSLAARLRLWPPGGAPADAAPGRLPARRHRAQPLHPRLGRRRTPGAAAGGDRRDALDVRRRYALLAARPAGGQGHRHPGCGGADRRRYRPRRTRRTPVGLAAWRRLAVRPGALGRQHRGAAARPRAARQPAFGRRAHRRWLAADGGPGDGAGAGSPAGTRRRAGRPGPARLRYPRRAACGWYWASPWARSHCS